MAFTPLNVERKEQIFPTLTESQLQRISRFGTHRTVKDGEILFRQGDEGTHFFVILQGELDVVQPQGETETLIVRHQPGNFTGETAGPWPPAASAGTGRWWTSLPPGCGT